MQPHQIHQIHQIGLILSRSKYTVLLSMGVILLIILTNTNHFVSANSTELDTSQRVAQQEAINNSEIAELQIGEAIEQELAGGKVDSYTLFLEANQYLQAIVEQKGIDVVVTIYSPDGKKVYEIDSPNGTTGTEPIYLITEASGQYKLEVRSLEAQAKSGKYKVKLEEKRVANDKDKRKVEAYKTYSEAVLLELEETPKSINQAMAKYEESIRLFQSADEPVGEANSLNTLAQLHIAKGEEEKAEPLCKRALVIQEKVYGSEHPDVARSLNSLAFFSINKGNYATAEPLCKRALVIQEKVYGSEHPDVARSLNNLARVYHNIGDYAKAETLFQRALAISEKTLGSEDPFIAILLNNLARVYEDKGEYTKAETLYLRGLAIRDKAYGSEHPFVATLLNNLAYLYTTKGDYAKAETLYLRGLAISEKAYGSKHSHVGDVLNDLAYLYIIKEDYAKAAPLLEQGLEIREKAYGPEHPHVVQSLNLLATIYYQNYHKEEYAKAELLLERGLAIREKAYGLEHRDVAASLYNLAMLYDRKGDYGKAEPLYLRSLAIREKVLGSEHPDVANSLNNLASLYKKRGDIEQAIKYKERADEARERELSKNLISGSEKEKLTYLTLTTRELDQTVSLHLQSAFDDKRASRLALTAILRRKGRALDATTDNIAILRARANKEDQALFDELSSVRSQYSVQSLKGASNISIEQHKANLNTLEQQIETLEKQVSSRSAEFRTLSQPITLDGVQKSIPDNAVLVEFISYQQYDAKNNKGNKHYAVYVLANNGEPLFADLGKAEVIEQAISKLRTVLPNPKASIEKQVKPAAKTLDQLVMKPVRVLIGDKKRLLVSPDGVLNLIPFEALVDEKGNYLVENYEISYLASGRDLLRLQTKIDSQQSPVIIGNPDFGPITETRQIKEGSSIFDTIGFRPLPATEIEAKKIKELFPTGELLLQKQATEEALSKVNAPSILHIATHGFFLNEELAVQSEPNNRNPKGEIFGIEPGDSNAQMQNPLLRSGIVLAGANIHQQGKEDQGIFTALKTTNLNLWGTNLVVLSACDTGVGDVKTGEGIYGLRRALVLAGSQTQVMSLWPINDEGTSDLMVQYYKALKAGEGRSSALRKVRLEFLKNPKHQHPYYWASFIQSGEWANLDGKR